MSLQSVAATFQAALLKRDHTAANAMLRAYGGAWKAIRLDLNVLMRRIREAQAMGVEVNQSWLFQQNRMALLLRQAETNVNRFAAFASDRIKREQSEAIKAARKNAEELFFENLPNGGVGVDLTFAQLPERAFSELVGAMGDGSPLEQTFRQFGPSASRTIRSELLNGLAAGRSIPQIARSIRESLGGDLTRAVTIARTETMRAYRTASNATYRENSDLVEGWRWQATFSGRTCAMCVSMHGSLHAVTEEFASHPRCRCTSVPQLIPYRALGLDVADNRKPWVAGDEWFAQQPEKLQRQILGPSALAAYQSGDVKLSDFVGEKTSPRWGRSRYTRSLKEILGERADRFRKAA